MGRHTAAAATPSDQPVVAATTTAANGALRFSYCEGGPGTATPDTTNQHCLIVAAQDAPVRAMTTRDGTQRSYTLNKGDIAIAPQGSDVTWQWFDPAKVVLIWLDPAALDRFVEIDMRLLLTGNTLENEVVITDAPLAEAALQLHVAAQRQDVGADIMFEALARVFLVTLVRNYAVHDAGLDASVAGGFGLHAYAAVLDHIEARLDGKITPASMAKAAGMSEANFARKFKLKTGQSPMNFVKEVRLRAALLHLQDGQLSLGEIALRCGFADQAHFSRVFRKATGAPPGHYRATLRP